MRRIAVFVLLSAILCGCDPYREGVNQLERGEYEKAAKFFYDLSKKRPDDPRVFHELGYAYSRLDMFGESVKAYNKALDLNPDYFESHLNLGTFMLKRNNYDEALPHLQKAIELKPESASAHFNLAAVLHFQGRPVEAKEELEKARELSREPLRDQWLSESIDKQLNYRRERQADKGEIPEAPGG